MDSTSLKIYGAGDGWIRGAVFARPGAGVRCTSVLMPARTQLSPWN